MHCGFVCFGFCLSLETFLFTVLSPCLEHETNFIQTLESASVFVLFGPSVSLRPYFGNVVCYMFPLLF